MEKMKVAINGFGRIGRLTFKILTEQNNVEVVTTLRALTMRTLQIGK